MMSNADGADSGKSKTGHRARDAGNRLSASHDRIVPIDPEVLRWAVERSGVSRKRLMKEFKKLPEWERGKLGPTYNQMHNLADTLHVPSGYLLMSRPPDEDLPVEDLRAVGDGKSRHNSPNLIDTIYTCEMRQSWYHDFSKGSDEAKPTFVGSAEVENSPEVTAENMREVLKLDVRTLLNCETKEEAKRLLIRKMDMAGVLVMTSGVVGNNNFRPLCPKEFRGFSLSDRYAPVIFVNLNTTVSEQLFTLANKFAHIWIGSSVISDSQNIEERKLSKIEDWCIKVADQFLAPLEEFHYSIRSRNIPVSRLPKQYSHRAHIAAFMSDVSYSLTDTNPRRSYAELIEKIGFERVFDQSGSVSRKDEKDLRGFYPTLISRVGLRFARAVASTCLNGEMLYQDAYEMLGISSKEKLMKVHRYVGMVQ